MTNTGLVHITEPMARELAVLKGVCVRPVMRMVTDRESGVSSTVGIACGATRESLCPPCAAKARRLRIQQCAEGWHRVEEPERAGGDSDTGSITADDSEGESDTGSITRRSRSTRRRDDAAALPKVPIEDRTVGRVFAAADGREYRPSMFLTLTLPSYGPVGNGGVPLDPSSYDYKRAALDAVHFSKLVDRFWQNLRRCAGYRVQYFATVEPQARLAAHLHAAVRGSIPRDVLRRVVKGTYTQIWWPPCDTPVYTDPDRLPRWDGSQYIDPATGECLPTWDEALARLDEDPLAQPVHVARFGKQIDMRGIIAPSEEADRAVRYLTKYLTKAIAEPMSTETPDERREMHVERMHQELRYLPCSTRCANWLRFGIQPKDAGPGLTPGWCLGKAHNHEHLGLGGRRVLVSRQWSGKTLSAHRADRAAVVREALLTAGVVAPEVERMAADVVCTDGQPRFLWTELPVDPSTYTRVIMRSIEEQQRWRAQYDWAKQARGPVESHSATRPP